MSRRERIFLAGAAGAIGRRMIPLLRGAGHEVIGTTRSPSRAETLRGMGVEPLVVDVFDAASLLRGVVAARPEVVIHQLTDLPPGLDPARMADAVPRNARVRDEGTRNLVAAARAAGARRLIAQSLGWIYRPGPEPHGEDDPLDVDGPRRVTVAGVCALEDQTLQSPPLEGVVLRYGQIYGPGTGVETAPGVPALHVDAAAQAAVLAIARGAPGVFNVAEPSGYLNIDKACRELGWRAEFRLPE